MQRKVLQITSSIFVVLLAATMVSAQCKQFTRKKCIPELKPYVHNGQFNSTVLFSGEGATVMQTFYAGMDYRLVLCYESSLSGAYYTVMDADENVIYSSKDKGDAPWDFRVGATQQLLIEITVPEAARYTESVPSGCVSLMIGFKQ